MEILGLGHIGLWTNDLEATMKLYCDVLGFKQVTSNAGYFPNAVESYFLKKANVTIEVMRDPVNSRPVGFEGTIDHLSLVVDDVDAAVAELKALGYQFTPDKIFFDPYLYEKGQRFASFRGPSNEKIQLEYNY